MKDEIGGVGGLRAKRCGNGVFLKRADKRVIAVR